MKRPMKTAAQRRRLAAAVAPDAWNAITAAKTLTEGEVAALTMMQEMANRMAGIASLAPGHNLHGEVCVFDDDGETQLFDGKDLDALVFRDLASAERARIHPPVTGEPLEEAGPLNATHLYTLTAKGSIVLRAWQEARGMGMLS